MPDFSSPADEVRKRQRIYDLFADYENPLFSLTVELDLPDFFAHGKKTGTQPFQIFLYHLAKASLAVPNFRLRILGGKVVAVEQLLVSYTVGDANGVFNFATFPWCEDFDEFLRRSMEAKKRGEESTELVPDDPGHRDYLYVSCIPWLKILAVQQPVGSYRDCSIPGIAWGKAEHVNGRVKLPIAIQAHHGLVDGIHIHQFCEHLRETLTAAIEL